MFVELCVGYLAARALNKDLAANPFVQKMAAGVVKTASAIAEQAKTVAETKEEEPLAAPTTK